MTGDLREHKPRPNCCVCIQEGLRTSATFSVHGYAVCYQHITGMQLAWLTCPPSMEVMENLQRILAATKPIGKQED